MEWELGPVLMLFRCMGFGGALGRAPPPVFEAVEGRGVGSGREWELVDDGGREERGLVKVRESLESGGAVRGWIILATPAEPPAWAIGFLATMGLVV